MLKIKTETGNAVDLTGLESSEFVFPYLGNEVLRIEDAKVENAERGIMRVEFEDFHLRGLNIGTGQTFKGTLEFDDYTLVVEFPKGLNVIADNSGQKSITNDNEVLHQWNLKPQS